jgi:membrane associated rhomboid family serine protease
MYYASASFQSRVLVLRDNQPSFGLMSSDRFYMRGDYPRPPTTTLVWLVAAMVAAFFVQLLLLSPWFGSSSSLPDLLRLSVRGMQQWHLWTLVTHGFLHSTNNPLHIIFSLIILVSIGRELEPQLGSRRFLMLFLGSLVFGALCWLALHWRSGGVHIGPGAGIMGLLVVLSCLYAGQQMNFMPFFVFSVTMRPMYFVYGLATIDVFLLVLYEIPGAITPFGFSPSIHLGGMLAGWLYFRFLHANNGWDRAASFKLPQWLQFRRKPTVSPPRPGRHREPTLLKADVDRILDKINSHGFGSLTAEEKRTLDAAKDLLSKN